MLNKVTLMGRLTKDPMVKYSQSGTAIARYTLAIDRRPGKNGEQVTDFIDCVAFGSSGKFVEKYLRKGRKIVACGKLELNRRRHKSLCIRCCDERTLLCG